VNLATLIPELSPRDLQILTLKQCQSLIPLPRTEAMRARERCAWQSARNEPQLLNGAPVSHGILFTCSVAPGLPLRGQMPLTR
jgi:hypothetical protein